MNNKKSVVIISASPKLSEKSVSDWLASRAESLIKSDSITVTQINVRNSMISKKIEQDYEKLLASDALIFIFPLYFFCLPGLLMRYLQDFYSYFLAHPQSSRIKMVFTVVNCGFPEADINEEAVRVIKSFSGKINAHFRFGLMIGGGGMLLNTEGAPFMKKTMAAVDTAFSQMKEDLLTDNYKPLNNFEAKVNFPRRLYYFMGGRGWISYARKNGLRKKDLYARPYV